jgi:LytR cell envelope-related transcriptional attenuator
VLVAAAALAFGVFGGGDGDQANTNGGTKPDATSTPDKAGTPKPTPASIKKSEAKIFVFNATGVGQLAAKYRDALVGEAYPKANTEIGSLAEDQYAQTSYVMYDGSRAERAARGVATSLGIEQVIAIDDKIKTALESDLKAKGKDWNVVVVIGQDKST